MDAKMEADLKGRAKMLVDAVGRLVTPETEKEDMRIKNLPGADDATKKEGDELYRKEVADGLFGIANKVWEKKV